MSTAESHRLAILSREEIDELYDLPRFTDEDRHTYFDLTPAEHVAIEERRGTMGVYLVWLLGCLKAKRMVFDVAMADIQEDMKHIVERHFPNTPFHALVWPSRNTRSTLNRLALELLGLMPWDANAQKALTERLRQRATRSTHPRYLFREAIQFLERHNVVTPPYTVLQDRIGQVVSDERSRLTQRLTAQLTPDIRDQLDALLQSDDMSMRLAVLKQEPNDFSYTAVKQELERRLAFQPLYAFAQSFLKDADLSPESSKYYASLVTYYTVYKLQRMDADVARLYLLCFAYYRYRQIHDHLIEAFLVKVRGYEKAAKIAAQEAMQQALSDAAEHLQGAGHILQLFVDEDLPPDLPFEAVKARAFAYLSPELIPTVADYMRNIAFDKVGYQWAYFTTLSMTIKRNLRQLFTALAFDGRVEDAPLMAAINFLQEHLRAGRSPRQVDPASFPTAVIPTRLRRYLYPREKDRPKRLDVDRYEFLVYRQLCEALDAGNVYIRDSHAFRQFEDDLISDERWADKEAVLQEVDAPMLLVPIEDTLAQLREQIEAAYQRVNARIESGENTHISVRGKAERRRWTLQYPTSAISPQHGFYAQLPGIGVADLLWFVAGHTGFLSSFTHVLERNARQTPDPREILACLVAMGTNMGLAKMAEVSGMSYGSLLTTARNFLRQETLRGAIDAISNVSAKLPVFPLYNIQERLHSSSDGQRMETQIDTLNARHSPKYFGLKKGVSICTAVANHVPMNGQIIGTHEYEGDFVFDLLFNNTSDIRPEQHSTDTHGTNQVNFLVLHAYGYRFAPRYRDFRSKVESLAGFHGPSHYEGMLIKPARKVKESLIISEWPNIQRILASLGLKEVTQSTIIRKLSGYARQNETKKALWELDSLYRTLYVLEYLDDVALRQSVQKALNRGEAYHRFRRAIAYVNSGKFRVQTEAEQQVWNDCSRLIANAIIHYNMALVSRVYTARKAAGDEAAVTMIKGMSPVAWQHINLYGNFEFNPTTNPVDLDALAAQFADPKVWQRAATPDPILPFG